MKLLLSAIVLALLTTLSLSAGPAMAASPTTNLSPEGMTPPPPPPPPAETVGSAPVAISEQQPPATGPDDGLLSALASGENTENLSAEQRAQTLQQYLLGTVTDVGFSPTEEEVLAALEELLPGPDAGPITTTAYAVSAELLVERAVLLLPAAAANIVTRVVQSYPERAAAIVTAAVTAAPDQEVAITTAAEAALPDPETAPAIAVPQQPPVININPMVTEYPGTTARDDGPGVTPGPPPGPPVPPEPTSPFVP
jgi:uncharacterized iron-regulated membrane protein